MAAGARGSGERRRRRWSAGQETRPLGPRILIDDDAAGHLVIALGRSDLVDHVGIADIEGGLAVGQQVRLLRWGQGPVHPDPDSAEPHRRVEEGDQGQVVAERHAQSVPGSDPDGSQRGQGPGGQSVEVPVGQPAAPAHHGLGIGLLSHRPVEDGAGAEWSVVRTRGHGAFRSCVARSVMVWPFAIWRWRRSMSTSRATDGRRCNTSLDSVTDIAIAIAIVSGRKGRTCILELADGRTRLGPCSSRSLSSWPLWSRVASERARPVDRIAWPTGRPSLQRFADRPMPGPFPITTI